MRKFDTKVQHLKYKVLREVARHAFEDRLLECYNDIPGIIVHGKTATMRCCVYKEKAIVAERIKMAIGGDKKDPNVIEVIEIACDECPMGGYTVMEACRGCIAHRCEDVCKRGAISYDSQQRAVIDKSKCVECGACAKACPYSAIMNFKRPCQQACKVKSISMGDELEAIIDESKCIRCGACVYQCPFGAITEKSYILEVIDLIKKSEAMKAPVYAVVAPSIASQFVHAKLGQVITGIKELGFYRVVEAALGADMVAYSESQELAEKGFLINSCCPAFVKYIEGQFPTMVQHISHNLSPMAVTAKVIKEKDPSAKVVFIGPCTAKKDECRKPEVAKYVDSVITFEELQALFDSRDIELSELEETSMEDASYYGRIFARSGGLSEAVAQALKEQGSDFVVKPISCDGIEACRVALIKASKNLLGDVNFIEGMACVGGCIGGAGCLTHGEKNRAGVDKYGKEAHDQTIEEAIKTFEG